MTAAITLIEMGSLYDQRQMLVVHARWRPSAGGEPALWAESSDLPAVGPRSWPPFSRAELETAPFCRTSRKLSCALTEVDASASVALALSDTKRDEVLLWLPGGETAPEASPYLLRESPVRRGRPPPARRDQPFHRPRCTRAAQPGDRHPARPGRPGVARTPPGASVAAFATLAGLALEIVAGGRVLPGLVAGERGQYLARWSPVGGGRDDERLRVLAESLPPLCRALAPGARSASPPTPFAGNDPQSVARNAMEVFADAACRDAIRQCRRSPSGSGP